MIPEDQKKRRGRKKKEDKEAEIAKLWKETEHYQNYKDEEEDVEKINITSNIEEKEDISNESIIKTENWNEEGNGIEEKEEPVIKKRGRKPKGGKLTMRKQDDNIQISALSNVILHLKCTANDLNEYNNKINKIVSDPYSYNPEIPPDIIAYNNDIKTTFFTYMNNDGTTMKGAPDQEIDVLNCCVKCKNKLDNNDNNLSCTVDDNSSIIDEDKGVSNKTINAKLKKLKISLYKNQDLDKKSACFWCTYEYDNHTCYIPKYELEDKIFGYGSFCRPECAVAYLMKENIDDSTKFERYHLLNQIYGKVYDYKKSIKPSPNPFYLLEKYYGNLTIQEYRKLLKTEHMLLVLEKPLTRILPELHDDNDDLLMTTSYQLNTTGGVNTSTQPSSSTNNTGIYKVKTQQDKLNVPSKSSIIRDRFCL
jgi:hypothetical protein